MSKLAHGQRKFQAHRQQGKMLTTLHKMRIMFKKKTPKGYSYLVPLLVLHVVQCSSLQQTISKPSSIRTQIPEFHLAPAEMVKSFGEFKSSNRLPRHDVQKLEISRYGEIADPSRPIRNKLTSWTQNDGRASIAGRLFEQVKLKQPFKKTIKSGQTLNSLKKRPSVSSFMVGPLRLKPQRLRVPSRRYTHDYNKQASIHHVFLNVLHQLSGLTKQIRLKKIPLNDIRIKLLNAFVEKSTHLPLIKMKPTKWPLALLNAQFVRGLLRDPTFMVTLFHAVEVAYMSLPFNFWLKPAMKFIQQPSVEKEERTWWRRRQLYDVLNGVGSSELQPNIRKVHFKYPGKDVNISFSKLVDLVRQLMGRRPPDPSHYKQPVETIMGSSSEEAPAHVHQDTQEVHVNTPSSGVTYDDDNDEPKIQEQKIYPNDAVNYQSNIMKLYHDDPGHASQYPAQTEYSLNYQQQQPSWPQPYQTAQSNDIFLEPSSFEQAHDSYGEPSDSNELMPYRYHTPNSSPEYQITLDDMKLMDQSERDTIAQVARNTIEESHWMDDFIRRQTNFVDSLQRVAGALKPVMVSENDINYRPK